LRFGLTAKWTLPERTQRAKNWHGCWRPRGRAGRRTHSDDRPRVRDHRLYATAPSRSSA